MQLINAVPTALLAATLVGGSVLLVPSPGDQAEYLLRDGEPQAALREGRAAYNEKPNDERVARVLAQVEMHLGHVDAAGDTLRRRVEGFPGSIFARRDLGSHYRSMGNVAEAIDMFLSVPPEALTPDERLFVAGHLRALRNPERERQFLGTLWRTELAEVRFARRYADLLIVEGKLEDGLSVLRVLDGVTGGLDTASRLKFFSVLRQSGHADEAADRSATWLSEQSSSELAVGLEVIADAGSTSSAPK